MFVGFILRNEVCRWKSTRLKGVVYIKMKKLNIFKKKKKEKKEDNKLDIISEYVKESLKAKIPEDKIMRQLLDKGYPKELILEAFKLNVKEVEMEEVKEDFDEDFEDFDEPTEPVKPKKAKTKKEPLKTLNGLRLLVSLRQAQDYVRLRFTALVTGFWWERGIIEKRSQDD